jgi:hypothetical protein
MVTEVFVLKACWQDEDAILGVFASDEKAQDALEEVARNFKPGGKHRDFMMLRVPLDELNDEGWWSLL